MTTVALDSNNNVISTKDSGSISVAEVNAHITAKGGISVCTSVIENAPSGLIIYEADINKVQCLCNHHQKTSGDGTDISHYTIITDLRWLKIEAQKIVDSKTYMLLKGPNELGFVYDGHYLSMSNWGQLNVMGLFVATSVLSFPMNWSARTLEGIYVEYSIADIATAQEMFSTGLNRKKIILNAGSTIKININSAVDQAAIDALVAGDTRKFSDYP